VIHSACPALPIPNQPILPLWKHIHRPHKLPRMSPAASDPASCVVSIFISPRRRTLLIGSTVKTRGPKMRDTSYLRAARRERRVSMSKSISSALGRLRLKYLCRCSCRCWLPPMFLLSPQPPRRSLLRRFRPPPACRCPRELRAWGFPHWRAGCAHFAYGNSFPVHGWSPPPCIRTRVHQEEAVTAIRQMKCAISLGF
jgi:hypothetical protein